jgi:AcrR family transcriptional regulator
MFIQRVDDHTLNEYSFISVVMGEMMGARVARSEAQAQRRAAILSAALELFAERGFYGTAVPVIAKRAGVGAGTLYRHFESKEAIVNALYQQQKRALGERIVSRVDVDQPARVQFHVYWTELAAFVIDSPHAFRFLELHHHAPYLDQDSLAIERQLTDLARTAFEQFQREQVVKDWPPNILMGLVHGAFVGFVKACDQGLVEMSPESVLIAEQCIWEAIRS